jgi:glucose-6-phosphate isomerase
MITFDFSRLMEGHAFNGINENEIPIAQKRIDPILREVYQQKPGFISIMDDLAYAETLRPWIKKACHYEYVVVLGIGGSALGNIALHLALRSPVWNHLSMDNRRGFPKVMFWDNIDPDWIAAQMDLVDPKKTLFNVISKSGSTAESMAAFLVVKSILLARGLDPKKHMLITTDPNKGTLRSIVKKEGIPDLSIPSEVGGRFSVLTPVGLLSAAMTGIDVMKVLRGAQQACQKLKNLSLLENPAAMIAFSHESFLRKGFSISVMLSYSNRLFGLADWYRQIWAESLGKRMNLRGEEVNIGQTPIKALGATDQHSQLPLYVEGPRDKIITLLSVEDFDRTIHIPNLYPDVESLAYLGGKTMNELMASERKGTQFALTQAHVPNMSVTFSQITEEDVGCFFFVYELATVLIGSLLEINPYDQPGVEAGKVAAYALMGRQGFEQQAKEIQKYDQKPGGITIRM